MATRRRRPGPAAMWRPSGSRAITGAPVDVPSWSRTTVAATTVAGLGSGDLEGISTALASMPAWSAEVSPWRKPAGRRVEP